jgi:hypothetical protein
MTRSRVKLSSDDAPAPAWAGAATTHDPTDARAAPEQPIQQLIRRRRELTFNKGRTVESPVPLGQPVEGVADAGAGTAMI